MGEIIDMVPASSEPVAVARRAAIHRVTLSNGPGNVLSVAAMNALLTALDATREDADCRVVVIAASGRVFSAGLDFEELTARRAEADGGRAFFEVTMRLLGGLMQAIVRHPKPVIAEVAGLATDAGCQLVASCDLAIASENASFCVPGANFGLFSFGPSVALSRNMSRKHAMEMLLTGETVDARTAREFGLVNRVVPPEYLTTVVEKYAGAIAAKPPVAVRRGKEAFYDQAERSLASAYDRAAEETVEALMSPEAIRGIRAVLDRRQTGQAGE